MENVLPLLALLACPVGMGLMMWMMMGGRRDAPMGPGPMSAANAGSGAPLAGGRLGARLPQIRPCLNAKVVGALAVVGLGVWAVAPNLIWAAIPLLLLAACPLSMLFMMRGMSGGQCASDPPAANQPEGTQLTREEQLAELEAKLAGVQAQQEVIARTITDLEGREEPALREAQPVARMADQRVQDH